MKRFSDIFGFLLLGFGAIFGVRKYQETQSSNIAYADSASLPVNNDFIFGAGVDFSSAFDPDENSYVSGFWGSSSGGSNNSYLTTAKNKAIALLHSREGFRDVVYLDSEGYETGGYGHLLTSSDSYSVGDKVPMSVINSWFDSDFNIAFSAAQSQAKELGKGRDVSLIVALTSVNYQLGTGWRSKFSNTWAKMKAGDYSGAISNIQGSLWARQTPVRTADFINTLRSYA